MKIGLREANLRFSKYAKMVKDGKSIILTERGKPFAVIHPLDGKSGGTESKIRLLEQQGILRKAAKRKFPLPKLTTVRGKAVSDLLLEGRKDRF